MLTKISFDNYKAFESGSLELKPITILLGANSSGKSSLIQLLLLLKQTINSEESYASALKLNGKYISLGEIENIFRNRNVEKELKLSFELQSDIKIKLRKQKKALEDEVLEIYLRLWTTLRSDRNEKFQRLELNLNSSSFKNSINFILEQIQGFQKELNKKVFCKDPYINMFFVNKWPFKDNFLYDLSENSLQKLMQVNIEEYRDSFAFLESLLNCEINKYVIDFKFTYSKKDNTLSVNTVSIKQDDKILIEYFIQKNRGKSKHLLKSDIFESKILDKYKVRFGYFVKFEKLNLTFKSDEILKQVQPKVFKASNEQFCIQLVKVFSSFTDILNQKLEKSKINYIGPLRAYPKRYYFLDSAIISNSLNTIDGDHLAETLKQEPSLVQKVNGWLDEFGLSISIENIKEVIHKLKIHQNGLNLDITDVGFGISQVLPIIMQGFLSKKDSITLIEQPEIHLHPMMQAQLADLFIDIISDKNEKKVLVIETHSESILKRLRRRIAEGKIKNTDVAIYFIHNRKMQSETAIIERLEIEEKGAFDWPKEFYTTDFEDINEFLKYQ